MLDGEEDETVTGPADDEELAGAEESGESGERHLDDDEEGLVVEIEGFDGDDEVDLEAPSEDETPLQRKLRIMLRDEKREKFALRRENEELKARNSGAAEQEVIVGEKPTLEGCEWDEEKFEAELTAWHKRVQDAEDRKQQRQQVEQQHRERFDQARQSQLVQAARIAKPEVYQEAEAMVGAALPQVLGNAITMYFGDRGPPLVLALHKRPDLLAKVAEKAKTDLVGSILDLHDMSKGVKMVKPAKKTFEREEGTRGSAPTRPVSADKKKDELEKEARKTGDWSKVAAYKREEDERKRKAA